MPEQLVMALVVSENGGRGSVCDVEILLGLEEEFWGWRWHTSL